jgi:hypothetical protein
MISNNDYVNFGVLGLCAYGLFEIGSAILEELRLYKKKVKILDEHGDHEFTAQEMDKLKNGDYVLISGKTEKIYARNSELLDKSVILSWSNSTYYEDFFLNSPSGKVVIQPYGGCRFHGLDYKYLTDCTTTWQKICRLLFFKKSAVVTENQQLYVFGKVMKKLNNIPTDLQGFINIKPKEITTTSLKDLKYYVPEKHSTTIFFRSLFFFALGIFTALYIKRTIFPSMKKWLGFGADQIVKRKHEVCLTCKSKPAHILCGKCKNFTNYCLECFKNLTDEISSGKRRPQDLDCEYCSQKLDNCIELLLNEANFFR